MSDIRPQWTTEAIQPTQSSQPCGCDPGANYYRLGCFRHAHLGAAGPEPPAKSLESRSEAQIRKEHPLATGCLDYFPDALYEIAHVSYVGNEQHNPGTPLHWDRAKSTDEADCVLRHFKDRGTFDTDGIRHTAKMAWRSLALLQKELEGEKERNRENLRSR